MKAVRMPQTLDDQFYILMWPADELLPAMFVFVLGVLLNQKLVCLALAVVITKLFRRMKEGNPDGFLLHLGYWYGLIGGGKAYTLPNPYIREFVP